MNAIAITQDSILPETRSRFIAKIAMGDRNDCWEWLGSRSSQGYGRFRFEGRATTAQRVSYAMWNGDLPEGLTVDHLCCNRGCVNPRHLEAVAHRVNVLRSNGVAAHHARKICCSRGHALAVGKTQRYCPICKREKGREWMRRRRNSNPKRYRV